MPVKILLADKSITIQKVVEMLFSGKEYEVACVSDGDTALTEAARVVPDVVLADIDLPRIDGYSFSTRLKQVPSLAQTPVILMMSRDDVFDEARARQASIVDHIAKPFESQELISKVKKAVGAPSRPGEPVRVMPGAAAGKPQTKPAAQPAPAAAGPAKQADQKARPKQASPVDIFDIIQEAPSQADVKRTPAKPSQNEDVYEVEPVVEVEEQLAGEVAKALPLGQEAVEEMRKGLGLTGKSAPPEIDITSFESLDTPSKAGNKHVPPGREHERRQEPPVMEREAREYVPPPPEPEPAGPQAGLSEARLRSITEEIVSRIAREHFKNMPSSHTKQISEQTVQSAVKESVSRIVGETAREVIEKVAWEVVPDLAAMLIREEIERLKAET